MFQICYQPSGTSWPRMQEVIRKLGYRPRLVRDSPPEREAPVPEGRPAPEAGPSGGGRVAPPAWKSLPAPSRDLIRAALDVARRNGRLVLVEFYADWCAPCRELETRVLPDPRVQEAMRTYVKVRVDADEHLEAGEAMRVASLPTLIVLDGGGSELERMNGDIEAPGLAAMLRRHRPAPGEGRP